MSNKRRRLGDSKFHYFPTYDEIIEMVNVSKILLELKQSDITYIKKYIIDNIKNMSFKKLSYIVSKYKLTYNFTDSNGNSLLTLACIDNNDDIYISLLEYKLNDPGHKNNKGYSVLHYIAYYSKSEYLIIYSTHCNIFDCISYDEETPLHIACKYSTTRFIFILINLIKNLNPLYDNKTPVAIALENDRKDVVSIIVNHRLFNINDINDIDLVKKLNDFKISKPKK